MRRITHFDKNGNAIKDLSKVKLPPDLEVAIFKILNPSLPVKEVKFSGAS